MEERDLLESISHLVAIGFDGSNNMMGANSGTSVRLQEEYDVALVNHCLSHSSASSCKAIFNSIEHMRNFQTTTFEAINLIKLSPKNEHFLEEHTKIASPCKLNPIPSKAGKIAT